MDELPRRLLRAAIDYVLARLRAMDTPDKMRQELGVAPPPDPAAVKSRIDAGLLEADAAATALAANDVANGARHAWSAVQRFLEAAALLPGVANGADAVQRAVNKAPPGALVSQLQLTSPTATPRADAVDLTWSKNDAQVSLLRAGTIELIVTLGTKGLAMTVRGRQVRIELGHAAPGVVRLLIGAGGSAAVDLELTVDDRGVTSAGSLGPIALPARLDAKVVDLEGLDLTLKPDGARFALLIRSRISTDIAGVLGARIDGYGVRLPLDADRVLQGGPPFGGLDAITPVAPNGIGLSLSAGPVSGSGYLLSMDDGFGGVLDLRLGPVKVTAFGLLRSVPGEGLSFVAVMAVHFPVPVELGFLFTLNAVGGIVGLGVTIDPAAISSGLKDGVLDRLLFPDDVRKAAPKILQTLAAVFPREPGGFVIGPMVRLAWGRPVSLVTLDVAVLLAVPDPLILVLGRARAAIPNEQAAIIDLRAAVLVQIGRGIVLLRAELFSSRVGFVSVYGGIGMLIRFEGERTVVISAGGFHPTYSHKPAELADLSRIGAEMSPPIGLQLRLQGYVALTPNTVQFGGSIELGLSVGVAAVRGSLTLDAIIQFDPFGFVVDATASAHVEVLGFSLVGVRLSLHLAGPSPWRVSGTGRVSLPWPLPDPSLDFGPIEIGDGAPPDPAPPPVRPLERVRDAMRERDAWQRVDRQRQRVPVRLRPIAAGELVIEPWGLVEVSQKAFPLEMTLDRHGRAVVEPAGCRISVNGAVTLGPGAEASHSAVNQSFPVGQFLKLTKDEQLAAPEFEDRQSGIAIDPAGAETAVSQLVGFAAEATMSYEDSWHERPDVEPQRGRRMLLFTGWAALLLDAGPAGAASLRSADRYLEGEPVRVIGVRPVSEVRLTDVDTGAEMRGFAPWSDAVRSARVAPGGLAAMTKVAMP
ncbi:DUF6603 domain-containing protein [Microbacterium ureisolvens]|uniref:DUF6603 domain-containing protein n=1 Tax=Microbacterium ureisolvens TaxID=2781186 RepID=A0ABS7I4M6_9MICO|nr:DUF6603 domain-containing protein [Microbacterium ureisolvens]MBW9111695.1 hypothetical protein [Microbacterium ureisolvens]